MNSVVVGEISGGARHRPSSSFNSSSSHPLAPVCVFSTCSLCAFLGLVVLDLVKSSTTFHVFVACVCLRERWIFFLNYKLCVSVRVFMTCAILRLRIANLLVMGSFCRGGIVNTRFGFSRALLVRRDRSKALWRFRASTSNSLSGRSRPPTYTPVR